MTFVDDEARKSEGQNRANLRSGDDLLWRHLKTVPAFRALLRAVEARFYRQVAIPEPVLDLGCGDGHFAQMAFGRPLLAGADPWWGPLQKARRGGVYILNVQALGDALPFPDDAFASVISNSVLEHIVEVEPVLSEAARVLQPGGRLVVTMPSHLFTEYLGGAAVLQPLGLDDAYQRFFNFISRHAHTDPPERWAQRLGAAGFRVTRWQYYFSKGALRALEVGHIQGLPSAVLHALTGHWILGPWRDNLRLTERWVRPYYEEEAPEAGAYLFMVAEKAADGPIRAALPEAQPFSREELASSTATQEEVLSERQPETAVEATRLRAVEAVRERAGTSPVAEAEEAPRVSDEAATDPVSARPAPEHAPADETGGRAPLVYGLTLVALLLGLLAQSVLSNQPAVPWTGVRLYGLALAALLGAALLGRSGADGLRRPSLRAISPERFLYPLALLLALLAQRQAGPTLSGGRAGAALFLWAAAIGLAVYALWSHEAEGDASAEGTDDQRNGSIPCLISGARYLIIPLTLLAVALTLRLINLTEHPFMLNGIEANLGLEAAAVAQGEINNPFATGWLTNPTLPLYFLAAPLQLFGHTVFGVRVLSAVVGALTVVATYVAGSLLWDGKVGLTAAVILAGSHLHLHYSRLGMSNIWDPLWVLLALGLVIAAARRGTRPWWLAAGLAVGLNAYFYTASHLLPLMLAAVLVYFSLINRKLLRRQGGHLLAAVALALVVALPILIYYDGHPGIFMERAQVLGIFQSEWLTQEAVNTGRSVPALLSEQFWRAALAFNYTLDTSSSYNAGIPLLRFWPAVFFVLGIGVAVSRLHRLRESVLLLWLGVTMVFGGALLVNPPASHRLLVAAPATALLAAIGLTWMWQRLLAMAPLLRRRELALLALLAVLMTAGDIVYYFGTYRQQPGRFGDRNTEVAFEMGNYLRSLEGEWTAYFHGPPTMFVDFPTISFLATEFEPRRNLYNVFDPEEPLPAPQQPSDNFVFIYVQERSQELPQTAERFPGGQQRAFAGVFANPLFYAYEVRR